MTSILVVGEDELCCALGEKIVEATLPGWELSSPAINCNGITKLVPNIPRYIEQSQYVQPVLCIADTDGQCAARLAQQWLPRHSPDDFLLRLAANEAESWLLADHDAFSDALGVPINRLPRSPDDARDPKRLVLALARRSRVRAIRNEVVSSADPNKQGTGYNLHLAAFVRSRWNPIRALERSPSLARAVTRVKTLEGRYA